MAVALPVKPSLQVGQTSTCGWFRHFSHTRWPLMHCRILIGGLRLSKHTGQVGHGGTFSLFGVSGASKR